MSGIAQRKAEAALIAAASNVRTFRSRGNAYSTALRRSDEGGIARSLDRDLNPRQREERRSDVHSGQQPAEHHGERHLRPLQFLRIRVRSAARKPSSNAAPAVEPMSLHLERLGWPSPCAGAPRLVRSAPPHPCARARLFDFWSPPVRPITECPRSPMPHRGTGWSDRPRRYQEKPIMKARKTSVVVLSALLALGSTVGSVLRRPAAVRASTERRPWVAWRLPSPPPFRFLQCSAFHRELSCRFRLLLREEARVHPGPGLHQADLSSLRRVRRLLNTVPGRCIGEGEP